MHLPGDDRIELAKGPRSPRGLVLMLHGGAERGLSDIDQRSLAYRRTRWMFESIRSRLTDQEVGVALLRFRVKGWNAGRAKTPSPVIDAREALARLREEYAGVPLVLLGHSMGGRTAAWVADEPGVVGVVGLAPWLPPDDPVAAVTGKHVVAAHGSRDRITSARATAAYLRRAEPVAASTRFVDMGPLGHYMFSGVRRWNETAVTASLGVLAGDLRHS